MAPFGCHSPMSPVMVFQILQNKQHLEEISNYNHYARKKKTKKEKENPKKVGKKELFIDILNQCLIHQNMSNYLYETNHQPELLQ